MAEDNEELLNQIRAVVIEAVEQALDALEDDLRGELTDRFAEVDRNLADLKAQGDRIGRRLGSLEVRLKRIERLFGARRSNGHGSR